MTFHKSFEMSKVNLDVAEKLDITCRRGDTFELTLTLKDSSGTALPLVTDDYKFLMQVRASKLLVARAQRRTPTGGGGEADSEDEYGEDGIVIGSSGQGKPGRCNFTFKDLDNNGNVTVFLSAADMRKVPSGRYKYDIQFLKGDTHKTLLEGRFTVNEDVSKSL